MRQRLYLLERRGSSFVVTNGPFACRRDASVWFRENVYHPGRPEVKWDDHDVESRTEVAGQYPKTPSGELALVLQIRAEHRGTGHEYAGAC